MRRKSTIIIAIMAALFLFAFAVQSMAAEQTEPGQSVTLSGTIENGQFTSDDGHTFDLTGDMAEELKQMEGQRVQIMGTVLEAQEEGGPSAVEIQDYTVEE
jgi:hypothetical protein